MIWPHTFTSFNTLTFFEYVTQNMGHLLWALILYLFPNLFGYYYTYNWVIDAGSAIAFQTLISVPQIFTQKCDSKENRSVICDRLLLVFFPVWKSLHQSFVVSFDAGQQATRVPLWSGVIDLLSF